MTVSYARISADDVFPREHCGKLQADPAARNIPSESSRNYHPIWSIRLRMIAL